jgi:hypothetical protein
MDTDTQQFPAARFIKEIGRGQKGARSMSREDAAALYGAMLDGRVSDLELGAILLAMRIKGESVEELAGFMDAAERSFAPLPMPPGEFAPVLIPSYNGARKLPNLTALLALLLAREGIPTLVCMGWKPTRAASPARKSWPKWDWRRRVPVPTCRMPSPPDVRPLCQSRRSHRNWPTCCRCAASWACAIPPIPS